MTSTNSAEGANEPSDDSACNGTGGAVGARMTVDAAACLAERAALHVACTRGGAEFVDWVELVAGDDGHVADDAVELDGELEPVEVPEEWLLVTLLELAALTLVVWDEVLEPDGVDSVGLEVDVPEEELEV
ncbi:hypothetical protein ONZ51_g8840 [Trametes cubensis]|uniref:Uncharacterized protein n=1 Tax=Trametes cubensis TaxID=1111947 RepID=A0AAD7TQ08_9APHY|nr:hypothetical protein ONZ51_g8840 [Trametes cubensis]